MLGWLLLVVAIPSLSATQRCMNGPYVFDNSCKIVSQGIGSSMNRMKSAVLVSQLYGITLIPNPECFKSKEHDTDLLEYFNWEVGVDCTAEDVLKAVPFPVNDETEAQAESAPLLRLEVTKYIVPEGDGEATMRKENDNIDVVCSAVYDGKDYMEVVRSFGNGEEGGNSLFPQMNRATQRLRDSKLGPRTVFMIENRYLIEGWKCSADFVYDRWLLGRKQRPSTHDPAAVTVAFHLRHGDVATKDINWLDPWQEIRTIPLQQGIEVLKNVLFHEKSVLNGVKTALKFYSEGNVTEFTDLTSAFPGIELHLGNAATLQEDIDMLATADVLLTSPSSFTALAATLNRDGVILKDKENADKFSGIDNCAMQTDIQRGDMTTFNEMFCKQKLYTQLKASICGEAEPVAPARHNLFHAKPTRTAGNLGRGALHMEIKRLRKKLNEFGADAVPEKIQQELHSSSSLWKDFVRESRRIGCKRNNAKGDYLSIDKTICDSELHGGHTVHASHANLQLSSYIRKVAKDIAGNGFQIPVYVVQGPNQKRRERLEANLGLAGVKPEMVTWEDGYLATNITEEDKKNFALGPDAYYICKDIIPWPVGQKACSGGYSFSAMEMSVALKHIAIIRKIAAKFAASRQGSGSVEGTPALDFESTPANMYSLVVEDDQFLPNDILRQIVEVVLQLPMGVGLVMLDDSFFNDFHFDPPKHLINFPFPRTYEKNVTRTVGAYLVSNTAAERMANGGNFLPLYAPVDHQINNAVRKHDIPVHWVFPPMTCAGSQGVEVGISSSTGGNAMDPGDRWRCHTCCNRFYNTSTMEELFSFTEDF
eukprot:GSChrysophyteH1.ASY1.ANO1.1599.1 assembled CDS